MPKPEQPERHGVPVCEKCKINAAWVKSRRQLCWWCEGEPAVNRKLSSKKGTRLSNDT